MWRRASPSPSLRITKLGLARVTSAFTRPGALRRERHTVPTSERRLRTHRCGARSSGRLTPVYLHRHGMRYGLWRNAAEVDRFRRWPSREACARCDSAPSPFGSATYPCWLAALSVPCKRSQRRRPWLHIPRPARGDGGCGSGVERIGFRAIRFVHCVSRTDSEAGLGLSEIRLQEACPTPQPVPGS